MAIYTKGRQMRIFISGPITGTKDYLERFAAAERVLKQKGYEVINPAKVLAVVPLELPWDTCMAVTLPLLKACDSIYMLRGWKNSEGAIVEYTLAHHCGIEMWYQDEKQTDYEEYVLGLSV